MASMASCAHRRTLTETESGYFVARSELEDFLMRQFGGGFNFEIQHSNYRWKFKTQEPIQDDVIRQWIEELQNRKHPQNDNSW